MGRFRLAIHALGTALILLLAACSQTLEPHQLPVEEAEISGAAVLFEQLYTDTGGATSGSPGLAARFVIPEGETWSINQIQLVGANDYQEPFILAIHADEDELPGDTVYSAIVSSFTISRYPGGFASYLLDLPTEATLGSGVYWLAVFTHSEERGVHEPRFFWAEGYLSSGRCAYGWGETWVACRPFEAFAQAFALFGSSRSSVTITTVLEAFDGYVTAGTLQGAGPGNSGKGRLNAVRNMLVTAKKHIDDGRDKNTCALLRNVYRRMDGESGPPDFVKGAAVSTLSGMVQQLRQELSCR